MKKAANLRLIERVVLPETTGKEFLSDARDTFSFIDPAFKNCGCSVEEGATAATTVEVYEVVKDGMFSDIFGGITENVDKLCLSQEQIKRFVEQNRHLLRTDGHATFFLFKANEQFLVAYVYEDSRYRLLALLFRFSHDHLWWAQHRLRLVVRN